MRDEIYIGLAQRYPCAFLVFFKGGHCMSVNGRELKEWKQANERELEACLGQDEEGDRYS